MATIYVRQGDNNVTRTLTCKNADGTYPSLLGATLRFHAGYEGDKASVILDKAATLSDADTGQVTVTFLSADTVTAYPSLDAEIQATFTDGTILTFPTKGGQLKLVIVGEVG